MPTLARQTAFAGVLLAVAALYQLTPAKHACLCWALMAALFALGAMSIGPPECPC